MHQKMGSFTALLDTRLEEILGHAGKDEGPDHGLWGCCESYELQVLLLLELRYFPYDREQLMQRYHSFFTPRFTEMGCRLLSALRSILVSELSRQLIAFRAELAKDSAPA